MGRVQEGERKRKSGTLAGNAVKARRRGVAGEQLWKGGWVMAGGIMVVTGVGKNGSSALVVGGGEENRGEVVRGRLAEDGVEKKKVTNGKGGKGRWLKKGSADKFLRARFSLVLHHIRGGAKHRPKKGDGSRSGWVVWLQER